MRKCSDFVFARSGTGLAAPLRGWLEAGPTMPPKNDRTGEFPVSSTPKINGKALTVAHGAGAGLTLL